MDSHMSFMKSTAIGLRGGVTSLSKLGAKLVGSHIKPSYPSDVQLATPL